MAESSLFEIAKDLDPLFSFWFVFVGYLRDIWTFNINKVKLNPLYRVSLW